MDLDNKTVSKGNSIIELTPKEFELLALLIRNENITLFRERIYEVVWGSEYLGDSRTIDLHMQRLRKKTGLLKQIKTIYKVGYRLEKDCETDEI